MIPALFQVAFAAMIVIPIALVVDRPFATVTLTPEAVAAVLWLGLLGSGLAYLCYFTILRAWGATRTSTSAYLLPVVGIVLGALVLGDPITGNRIGGVLLIIAGIALVNSGPALRRLVTSRAQADAGAGAGSA